MTAAITTPRLIRPSFIAVCLDVEPATVRRWIRDGVLHAVDVTTTPAKGRPTYRVLVSSFETFLRSRGISDAEISRLIVSSTTENPA